MDLSRCRQRLRQITDVLVSLLPIFFARRPLLKGGIYQAKTKCGKKGCKCEREGELHIVWRFYRSREGKAQIITLKEQEISKYQRFTQNYQSFRQARARLVKIHQKQIELINLLEKGMTKKDL